MCTDKVVDFAPHQYQMNFDESTTYCKTCGNAFDWAGHKTVYVPITEMEEKFREKERKMDGQTLIAGVKKDEGKPRWELLPYDAVEGVVRVLTSGAVKYEARNWEKGIAYGRVFGAIMRHLWKWWMAKVVGETGLDDESGRSHLDHAMCELMFLSAYEKRGMTQLDDRPVK